MKNITVSVDEPTYRMARVRAAELETSVSAIVREQIRSLANGEIRETAVQRFRRTLKEIDESMRARGCQFSAADRLSREELYDRDARRREHEEHLKRDALR